MVDESNFEVFNPHDKPLEELPYIIGFNNGGSSGLMSGQLISQAGMSMGSHMCSNEYYMLNDLGITKGSRSDRHESFKEHYPDGYRMTFRKNNDPLIDAAMILNEEMNKEDEQ